MIGKHITSRTPWSSASHSSHDVCPFPPIIPQTFGSRWAQTCASALVRTAALISLLRSNLFVSEPRGAPTPNVQAVRDQTGLPVTHFIVVLGPFLVVLPTPTGPGGRPR